MGLDNGEGPGHGSHCDRTADGTRDRQRSPVDEERRKDRLSRLGSYAFP